MIVPRAAATRRRLALLAIQLGLFVAALGGPAAVHALQIHSVVISPTTAVVGTPTTFTVTVTNLSVSPGQTLMSCVRIAIPASLTLSGTPTVTALDPPVPPGTSRPWSAPTVVTDALQTVRTGLIINDVNPDGQVVVTFTGTPTAAGDLTFTTTAFGQVNCSGQTSLLSGSQPTVTVTAVNDAPVCSDDAGSTAEEVALLDAVTCTDVDGDTLTYAAVTGPANGDLVFNPDGTFTYTPDPDFSGVDTFTFTADDGDLTSNTATFTVTVTAVNDAPVCSDDAGSTAEEVALLDAVTCTDVDGDTLTYAAVTGPANGDLVFNPDGTFTYTPDPDFSGVDTFTFTADDGDLTSNTATFTVTVTAVNDAPVCSDDAGSTAEEVALLDAVTCTDVDGDTLTYAAVTGPANGDLVFNPDGTFTYTPDPDFSGVDTFTFTADDGDLTSNTATFTVTVTAVNDAPVCSDDAGSTAEEVALLDAVTCTDVDGDTLTYAAVTGPANGDLVFNPDGTFTYTPDPDFSGVDTFTFTADDGDLTSNTATFTVTVGAGNDPPVLAPIGPISGPEGSPLTFTATATDADVPPDTLTFSLTGAPSGAAIDPVSGVFTWTPPNDGVQTFDVCVSDGTASDCESVTVTVSNVAPSVTLTGPASATAGQTLTFTYVITDPGDDTHAVVEDCGDAGVYVNTPTAQSFDCRFPSGPATSTVSVTVDDGAESNSVGTAATQVAVAAGGGSPSPTPTPTPSPSPASPPATAAPTPGADGELPDTALPPAAPLTLVQLLVAAVVSMGTALALADVQSASPAQRGRRRR